MTRDYLKKATLTATSDASEVHETVQNVLTDIEAGGDDKAMEYAAKFDRYDGNILLTKEEIDAAIALVPEKLKADIRFAHDNVKRFAELQKSTISDVEMEIEPGFLQPHRQRNHDGDHRKSRRLRPHHGLFPTPPRCGRGPCNRLCSPHLWR